MAIKTLGKALRIRGGVLVDTEVFYFALYMLYFYNCTDIPLQVASTVLESGQRLAQEERCQCPLMYEWHEKKYLGAAHGIAGILYLLMQVLSLILMIDYSAHF